ncbi:MAG TPA: hypothetical protein DHW85_09160, partial [Lachnospiraceae bacterium]|nr:hypothetical protein [Lachnospiraceae bacterium]
MEDGNPRPGAFIIIFLILLNAFLVVAKTAFDNVSESTVRKKAEEGEQRALRLSKLFDKPDYYRHALLFSFLATNTMIG